METGFDHIINVGRSQPRLNWTLLSLIGVGVLLVGALFGSAATARGWLNGGGDKVPISVASYSKVNDQTTITGGSSPIAKAVTPAVVTINVSTRKSAQQTPFMFDPFRDLFPNQDDEDMPRRRNSPRQ